MKRSIIRIDEEKCTGCGACVPACHEGAIAIVEGKARLRSDSLCDGLGACLGECPEGAIIIEEREAESYNEIEALVNIMKEGPEAVRGHLKHLAEHQQFDYLHQAEEYLKQKGIVMSQDTHGTAGAGCGCPGSAMKDMRGQEHRPGTSAQPSSHLSSELQQWPIQLRLLNPAAPFFQDADLVVCADCVPFSYADFHRKFLKGRALAIFCPKLDDELESYVAKLADIFKMHTIKSVTVAQMEVPCCSKTERIVEEAVRRSGKNIIIRSFIVSREGELV